MFSFFHRTSKITLDCYTTEPHVYQLTPIVKSSKTIPDWWKELPNLQFTLGRNEQGYIVNQTLMNLKDCYGFLEYFSNSICIPHWSDIFIETTKDSYHWYNSYGPNPDEHEKEQVGKGFADYHHIKLSSPWFFREKTGVQFVWVGAEWNLDKFHFKVLPGVLEFRVNCGVNVNIMLPKEEKRYIIPANQPLANIFPLSEKNVVVKNHLVTEEEKRRIVYNPGKVYFNGWRSCKKILSKNDKKCPFGFGE